MRSSSDVIPRVLALLPRGEAAEAFVRHAADVALTMNASLTLRSLHGESADSIQSLPASMIVVNGSAADQVLRWSSVPVWLTELRGQQPFQCRSVLCVLNLDGSDHAIAREAANMAQRTGADLYLLHVLQRAGEFLSWSRACLQGPSATSIAADRLRATADRLAMPAHILVRTGGAVKAIADAASMLGADLVVTGRGAAQPHPLAVLEHVTCPVLVVPGLRTSGGAACPAA